MAVSRNKLRDMPMKSSVLLAMRNGRPNADGSFWITDLLMFSEGEKLG
jgi:hypothetical protein